MQQDAVRCKWVNMKNPLYVAYHDTQWGVPVHDDTILFEMLVLEGAQAGLSWETVLNKREAYRVCFKGFDPAVVAAFPESYLQELLQNPLIIRNRLKLKSAVANARVFCAIQKEFGSFDAYLWAFVNNQPVRLSCATIAELPVTDAVSDALSKDLKKRGMNFVGSTIMYAYMQAVGMIFAHTTDCFCYR